MKRMKLKRFLVSTILIIVTLTSFNVISLANNNISEALMCEYMDNFMLMGDSITIDKSKDEVLQDLIAEVQCYIDKQSPLAYDGLSEHLVKKCLENDLDICFAMAQTQNETNFGTTGAGRRSSRCSLFGVAGKSYSSYENAIIDYINVLKKYYLTKGRTERSLMNNYVTTHGTRYAADIRYESCLKNTYNAIKHSTNIYKLQKHYSKM